MCTISWVTHACGYDVFFNRDESRQRCRATPPHIVRESLCAIMPIDPQGGGTWISVNEYGLTCALLNYYQGSTPEKCVRSRGLLVAELSQCRDIHAVQTRFSAYDLSGYAPFSLLVFDRSDIASGATFSPALWRWDGKALQQSYGQTPLISSAYDFDAVVAARSACFDEVNAGIPLRAQTQRLPQEQVVSALKRVHASHTPEKSAYSICMHRPDAKTQSFSHITVGQDQALFNYTDGSPCCNEPLPAITLQLL